MSGAPVAETTGPPSGATYGTLGEGVIEQAQAKSAMAGCGSVRCMDEQSMCSSEWCQR